MPNAAVGPQQHPALGLLLMGIAAASVAAACSRYGRAEPVPATPVPTSGADLATVQAPPSAHRWPTPLTPAQADTTYVGDNDHPGAGRAVLLHDFTGDGLPESVVAAPGYGAHEGTVWMLDGASTGAVALGRAGALIQPPTGTTSKGRALAALSGFDQSDAPVAWPDALVLGVPGGDGDTGEIWLLVDPLADESAEVAPVRVRGSAPDDRFGMAVAAGTDPTQDGSADVLVGAPGAHGGGAACLLEGASVFGDTPLRHCFAAAQPGDYAGQAVTLPGDLSGDGVADVVVSAWANDRVDTLTGATYLVEGPIRAGSSLADADASLLGVGTFDAAGISVASAGDTDGDGHSDLLVGAIGVDDGAAYSAGAVYFVRGPLAGKRSLARSAGRVDGAHFEQRVGHSLAGNADLDRDGYSDALIGATGERAAGTIPGGAWAVYGPVTGPHDLRDLARASGAVQVLGQDHEGRAGVAVSMWASEADAFLLIGADRQPGGGAATRFSAP